MSHCVSLILMNQLGFHFYLKIMKRYLSAAFIVAPIVRRKIQTSYINSRELAGFDKVCVTGDFNFPRIKWNGCYTNEEDNRFIETLRDAYLTQAVTKPTRRQEGQSHNILDLVLVNDETIISDIIYLSRLGKSDHDMLSFDLYIPCGRNLTSKNDVFESYNLGKANFENMKKDVNHRLVYTAGYGR